MANSKSSTNYSNISRKGIFAFLGAFLWISTGAQSTFNIRVDYDSNIGQSTSILETDCGYLLASVSLEGITYSSIGLDGSVLEHKYHGYGTLSGDNLQWLNDSTTINSGFKFDEAGDRFQFLIWTDAVGDSLRTVTTKSPFFDDEPMSVWDDPTYIAPRRLILDHSAIFETSNLRANSTLVRRYDLDGEIEWEYIFDPDLQHEKVWNETFLVKGDSLIFPTRYFSWQFTGDNKSSLIFLSKSGDWIDEVFIPDNIYTVNDAVLTEDENLILATLGANFGNYPRLVSIDLDGNINWELHFPLGPNWSGVQGFYSVKSLGNNEFIAGGTTRDGNPEDEEVDGLFDYYGLVVKFTGEGEVIWERRYTNLHSQCDDHELADIRPTSDGGFIFCGESRDCFSNGPQFEAPHQRGWVVKLDEHGCLVPGCQETGIPGSETFEYFRVGPNPFTSELNIYLGEVLKEGIKFTLYDASGRKIDDFFPEHSCTTYTLEVHEPAGWYVLELRDETGVLQREKIVKQ